MPWFCVKKVHFASLFFSSDKNPIHKFCKLLTYFDTKSIKNVLSKSKSLESCTIQHFSLPFRHDFAWKSALCKSVFFLTLTSLTKKPIRFVIGVTIVTHLWLDVLCIFVGRTRIKLCQSKVSSNVGKIVLFERISANWFYKEKEFLWMMQNSDLLKVR